MTDPAFVALAALVLSVIVAAVIVLWDPPRGPKGSMASRYMMFWLSGLAFYVVKDDSIGTYVSPGGTPPWDPSQEVMDYIAYEGPID